MDSPEFTLHHIDVKSVLCVWTMKANRQQIPYTLSVPAVYALLGSSARVLTADFGPAIHIVMDRSSGKTGNECFVEFFTTADAEMFVQKMRNTSSTTPVSRPSTPQSDMSIKPRSPYRHGHHDSSGSYSSSRFATPTPSRRMARQMGHYTQDVDPGYASPQSYTARHEARTTGCSGSPGIHKLGDRTIYIELSTQDALLSALFPKAKNVTWANGEPAVHESNEVYNSGFRSFVTKEELVLLVKYAEAPQKVYISVHERRCVTLLMNPVIVSIYHPITSAALRVHDIYACQVPLDVPAPDHPRQPQRSLQCYKDAHTYPAQLPEASFA